MEEVAIAIMKSRGETCLHAYATVVGRGFSSPVHPASIAWVDGNGISGDSSASIVVQIRARGTKIKDRGLNKKYFRSTPVQ